jgi:hypothetical protein
VPRSLCADAVAVIAAAAAAACANRELWGVDVFTSSHLAPLTVATKLTSLTVSTLYLPSLHEIMTQAGQHPSATRQVRREGGGGVGWGWGWGGGGGGAGGVGGGGWGVKRVVEGGRLDSSSMYIEAGPGSVACDSVMLTSSNPSSGEGALKV